MTSYYLESTSSLRLVFYTHYNFHLILTSNTYSKPFANNLSRFLCMLSVTAFLAVYSSVSKIKTINLYILSVIFGAPVSLWSDNVKTFILPLRKKEAGEIIKCKKSYIQISSTRKEYLILFKERNTYRMLTALGVWENQEGAQSPKNK